MPSTDAPDRPPGWYADPSDGGRLTYWDGRRWTRKRRPRPAWQAPSPAGGKAGPASPEDAPEARRRSAHGPRSWVLIGVTVLAVVGLAWITLPKPDHPGPRVLTDTSFVAAASQLCRTTINNLRPPLSADTNDQTTVVSRADIADGIVRTANGLDGLSAKLRALPVAAVDQPHVDSWLSGWDQYTGIGRQYAAAVRAEASTEGKLSRAGDKVQKSTDRFARANGLQDCQFFIVPPSTGSDPFSGGG